MKLKIYNGFGRKKREMLVIYHTIFANNSKTTRDKFFKSEVVKGFWSAVLPFMTKKFCFENKKGVIAVNPNLVSTFREIAQIITVDHHLPMPTWWGTMF